jgi:ssRNA-specific RNase YbeY (16S rRNA maturation enzyme)
MCPTANFLGELVICAPVVAREARAQESRCERIGRI